MKMMKNYKSLKIIDKNLKIRKLYEIIEKMHIKFQLSFRAKREKYNSMWCLNSSIHIMQDER